MISEICLTRPGEPIVAVVSEGLLETLTLAKSTIRDKLTIGMCDIGFSLQYKW